MRFTSLSNAVCTIGSITILCAIAGTSLMKPAQAQANSPTASACSAAYFDDPGYMYNTVTQEQFEAVEKYQRDPERIRKWDKLMAEIKTFSAPLDSPLGYVVKTVNGKPVAIPPKIEQAIKREVYGEPSANNRKRAAELNQKYGQYATFGQNITLIFSPEQREEAVKDTYAFLAYIASLLTPEQRQAERDRVTASGDCSQNSLFKAERYDSIIVDTGTRPDFDKRLREDTTGATLFN